MSDYVFVLYHHGSRSVRGVYKNRQSAEEEIKKRIANWGECQEGARWEILNSEIVWCKVDE